MPALEASDIVRVVEDTFTESVASAVLVSRIREHPRRFYVTAGEASFPVWIYIWTLTHGGVPQTGGRISDSADLRYTSITGEFRRTYFVTRLRAEHKMLHGIRLTEASGILYSITIDSGQHQYIRS